MEEEQIREIVRDEVEKVLGKKEAATEATASELQTKPLVLGESKWDDGSTWT